MLGPVIFSCFKSVNDYPLKLELYDIIWLVKLHYSRHIGVKITKEAAYEIFVNLLLYIISTFHCFMKQ